MKVEEHESAYKEHLQHITRAIEEGVEQNQRNIGYNVSQGSVELFSIYLHKMHLIQSSGEQFDHRIFKNNFLIKKRISFDFPLKAKILKIMKEIELGRNILCYGKRKSEEKIKEIIKNFNELRKIINKNLNRKNGKK